MVARLAKAQAGSTVALVTGGSRGLGLAAAKSLLQAGMRVAIVGRDKERLHSVSGLLQREFGPHLLVIRADVAVRGAARRAVAQTLQRFHRIDTVVAAAGDVPVGSLESLEHGDWQTAFAGKLFGHIALFREVQGHMRARGSGLLIGLTGATGKEPTAGNIAAGAVNAAFQNVMKALARDLGPAGIRVLTISPGPFLTDRLRTIAQKGGRMPSDSVLASRFSADVPLGRVGDPAELGAIVRFLHTPESAFLHGTTIVLDGGKQRSI
jgi:3-oxoacyl-[acyl-carrier protein] reductase